MKNGKPMATSYKTKEAVKFQEDFCNYVKEQCAAQMFEHAKNKEQHFYVDGDFYFPRTDMDANNYWKILLDAITYSECVWFDDNIVCERVNRIMYDVDNPRIELHIHPVDYIGVFENSSQLLAFQRKNCVGCTRYKRNCSLLKNAIEGRIQVEIDTTDMECSVSRTNKEHI